MRWRRILLARSSAWRTSALSESSIYGESPASAAKMVHELGMQVCSAHLMPPFTAESIEVASALGIDTLVVPWLPPERFVSADSVAQVCDEVNAADAVARAHGLKVAYHNHDFEIRALADGSIPLFDHMLPRLASTVGFELDIYWVKHAGNDPAQLLRQLGARVPLVHVKDGTGVAGAPFVAAGDGIVDIPAALAEAKDARWLICELDACATDMFEALDKSARYLVAQGFGHLRA
jgi:sugar phosphate isomerase/epimerase